MKSFKYIAPAILLVSAFAHNAQAMEGSGSKLPVVTVNGRTGAFEVLRVPDGTRACFYSQGTAELPSGGSTFVRKYSDGHFEAYATACYPNGTEVSGIPMLAVVGFLKGEIAKFEAKQQDK